jgi:hypothetical protein
VRCSPIKRCGAGLRTARVTRTAISENGAIGGTPALFSATQVVTQSSAPLTGVIALEDPSSEYYDHPMCAVRADHTLWCWGVSGANGGTPTGVFWGTTGSTASVPYAFPLASGPAPSDGGAAPLIQADRVSVGADSLCFLYNGVASCLGMNVSGNLGNGTAGTFEPYPVAVTQANGLPATIDSLASSYRTTCARAGGGVWCWGDNNWAQIGDPGAPDDGCGVTCKWVPTPVQVALPDGGATSFPDAGIDQSPLTNVTQIVAGYLAFCALDTNGDMRCWGAQYVGGTKATEATLYDAGSAPSTNIAKIALSAQSEDTNSGARFLTQSGVLVDQQQVVTPICP